MINRAISLPKTDSFFLLGPRQTGKSTLIKSRFPNDLLQIDLLLNENFLPYSKDPSLFRKHVLEDIKRRRIKCVFVDEIQRVPPLLNEIQALMNETKVRFILTGSSARKLKRGNANLLGGRARERILHPLTYTELKDRFELEKTLHFGSLPPLLDATDSDKRDILSSYVNTYLREEIQAEGLSRNLGGFSRFLDIVASQCGELVNYSATGRECQLPTKTVQSYYEILEDTLVAMRLSPWSKSMRRRLVTHPKYYLFDVGVTNALNHRLTAGMDAQTKGRLFEHWLILEAERARCYSQTEARLYYWRTNHGAEVDLVIEKHGKLIAAIEIKSTSHVSGSNLTGLRSFSEEYPATAMYVVSTTSRPYKIENVHILPWTIFLEETLPSLF